MKGTSQTVSLGSAETSLLSKKRLVHGVAASRGIWLALADGTFFVPGQWNLRRWKWVEPRCREGALGSELALGLSSVGGSQNLRFYWKEFVNEVDVLVFMVDSTDRLRLPWARQELQKLLDKDPDLPVVIVANKQVSAMGGGLGPLGLLTNAQAQ